MFQQRGACVLILCICVTDLPSWLLCWLLCCIARTCRMWCDGGSLSLTVHTDMRRHNSRKTFRLLRQVDSLTCYLVSLLVSFLFVCLFNPLCQLVISVPQGRVLMDAFRTLTVLCTVIVKRIGLSALWAKDQLITITSPCLVHCQC